MSRCSEIIERCLRDHIAGGSIMIRNAAAKLTRSMLSSHAGCIEIPCRMAMRTRAANSASRCAGHRPLALRLADHRHQHLNRLGNAAECFALQSRIGQALCPKLHREPAPFLSCGSRSPRDPAEDFPSAGFFVEPFNGQVDPMTLGDFEGPVIKPAPPSDHIPPGRRCASQGSFRIASDPFYTG